MATIATSAGSEPAIQSANTAAQVEVFAAIQRLFNWLEAHDYRGYDTFDGLSSWVRPLTFETRLLQTVLLQGVRRFPLNLRPILGIPRAHSSKGMGFLARGFIRLHQTTGDSIWAEKAEFALQWLIDHQSPGYSGAAWGNHFDYVSRGFYLPKGTPTVVWTSLIGHAFLDAFDHFRNEQYLDITVSACQHILRDLKQSPDGLGACISYIPVQDERVHNANSLGGSLLARVYFHTGNEACRASAEQALRYTAQYQRPDGFWYYGEAAKLRWVDNFHTAYVLDCYKHYVENTGDHQFDRNLERGYEYWKQTFFLEDGTPRYYNRKTLPLDIQCCSQAIDTLVFFSDRDPEAIPLALQVTRWTIANMQDRSGYFYYRRYARGVVNKTPTLHWGQATMMCALAALYRRLQLSEPTA